MPAVQLAADAAPGGVQSQQHGQQQDDLLGVLQPLRGVLPTSQGLLSGRAQHSGAGVEAGEAARHGPPAQAALHLPVHHRRACRRTCSILYRQLQ